MQLIKFSFKYIFRYGIFFVFLLFFHIIKAIITIVLPYMSGIFIDYLMERTSLNVIYKFIIIYSIVALLQIVLLYCSTILHTYIYSNISINLTTDMIKHMQKLPLSFYTNKDIAYIVHRIQNDSNTVITFVLTNALDFISNIISTAGTFYMVFKVSKSMCIIYIIALIIYLLQYIITKKMLYSTSQKTRETESRLFSVLLTQFKFLKIIKLFNTRELFNTKLDTSYKELYNATMKLQKVMCIFQSNQIIVSTLFRIVLLLFGGIQVINGRVSIGIFSVLLGYLGIVMNSVVYFANLGQSYVATLVSYNRLKELVDLNEESNGEEVLTQINTISLQNLSYGYNGNFLIQKFDYVFEKGKIYGICGANGIGKTTFLDILVGLNQEYMGTISYNQNIDLKNIDNYMMREQLCCYVSQDALLYEDSILNNILVNREGIDRREVERLAKQIGLFREGSSDTCLALDYIIDDNKENLSGGERQKIALLRSFIGIKDLIIYDEPTSYLDSDTRNFFIGKLLEMKEKNKIIIIITHDKELCKYCDDVINLENYKK